MTRYEHALARSLKARIGQVLNSGYWFCHDCACMCERVEGEQGQPAHCGTCRSPRIEWYPPAFETYAIEKVFGRDAVRR